MWGCEGLLRWFGGNELEWEEAKIGEVLAVNFGVESQEAVGSGKGAGTNQEICKDAARTLLECVSPSQAVACEAIPASIHTD